MTTLDPADPVDTRLGRLLGLAPWLALAVGTAVALTFADVDSGGSVRIGMVVTCGVVLVGRVLLVGARTSARRRPLAFLSMGLVLWVAGFAVVAADPSRDADPATALGGLLRLAAFVGMAGFVLTDEPHRPTSSPSARLEATVVWAGVCGAVFAAMAATPGALALGREPQLLTVLVRLTDMALVALVVSQLLLRQRDPSVRTGALILGAVGLAVAGSDVMARSSSGSAAQALLVAVVGGASLTAIVGGACVPPPSSIARPLVRQATRAVPVVAALAVVVLASDPGGATGWTMRSLALVILIATVARLTLALRDAQGAAEATRLSLTDDLTGLPNRRALLAAADDPSRAGAPLGVLLLDLDGFKDVNDSLGHTTGDGVLVALAQRMRATTDHRVMVARLGGDEFALLTSSVSRDHLLEIAQRVRAALRDLLRVESFDLSIDASVGIALRADDDTSSTEMLRRADIAMYAAKTSHAGVVFFDPSQDGFSRLRLRRGEELRQALAAGQLIVWYQPQVEARTGAVVAMEALIRWWHPSEGLLQPIAFLPDVRRAGLMPALTELVMSHVVADARRWRDDGLDFRVAMNCAPPELVSGELLPKLFSALDAAGLPEDTILVEVTEDSFLTDPERARDALRELRAHHVQVSVDDYGTGFSSLAYLRDLPVQELKLDRSFIAPVVHDERSRMIVRTTSEMARALGLRLVAEGVEDADVAATLLPLGIDVFQGYHVARPMPADDVATWVRRWTARHSAADLQGQVDRNGSRERLSRQVARGGTDLSAPPTATRGESDP